MSLLESLSNLIFWRKSYKDTIATDLRSLDSINSKLEEVVLDTSSISKRIIRKLENKIEYIQQELSEREELLGHVFSGVSDVLILKDGEGRWNLVNSYGKKVFGIEHNEYKNKTDFEMCDVSPRFKEMFEVCIKTDIQAWESKETIEVEERSTDYFGEEIVFDVIKTPIFNEDGSRKHLLVHGKNVTEELANTKHIRMLMNALNKASDSITVTDHNHNTIYANEAFLDLYGYSLEEVLNKPRKIVASGLTPNETYISMFEKITKALPWSGEMINKTKTGEILNEMVSITPVLNGKPYPIYYIAVNRPINGEEYV